MSSMFQFKTIIPPFLVAFALACFGLLPRVNAVVPPPDGGYPNGNTAEGDFALQNLMTGNFNTALGFFSLFTDTAGLQNTAVGAGALFKNTADNNTASGAGALFNNTTGTQNTANGLGALFSNTTIGVDSGHDNTATGFEALASNTIGPNNTAVGSFALVSQTVGNGNSAFGKGALFSFISGEGNTALGDGAGSNLQTGNGNVYIGGGVHGFATESQHTYIGNINTTSVSGGGTDTVTINLTTGLLGHLSSSRRYKENIKPMESTSEALYQLKPVTYRYKKEIDSTQSPAFGLIAEEVAEVNPALVARNSEGQPESVHYEMVNAMLLNEFLKEHRKVDKLEKQVEALTAGLQKVSAQLELSKAAPQTVLNNQ
jgi:Chaperone of endosialidase